MSVSTMRKLTVFAFKEDADKILRKLMNQRCVQVETVDISDRRLALRRRSSEEELKKAEKGLSEVGRALPYLNKYSEHSKGLARRVHEFQPEQFALDGRLEKAKETVRETLELAEKLKELSDRSAKLSELSVSLVPWMDYGAPLSETETKLTKLYHGSCILKSGTDELAERLDEIGAYLDFVWSDKQKNYYFDVVFCKEAEAETARVLSEYGFVKLDFSEVTEIPEQAMSGIEAETEKIGTEELQLEEKLRTLSESLDLVEIYSDLLETDRRVALLHQKLAQTGACSLLEGWIPTFVQDAVEEKLQKFECAYEIADAEPGEEPPILLRNNKFAMNFEWVVGMYSYPKYGRFDPTFIMSIFYFIIFGLMFADVGYGLLLVIGCFGGVRLLNPKPGMRRMLYMFGYCGIAAMISGVLFGGWFGDMPTAIMQNLFGASIDNSVGHFFGNGLWFNPLNDPVSYLILSLGVGLVHLVAGMAVNFVILCKDKKAGEAICTVLPYWVLFLGFGLMLINKNVGMYTALAGAVMILLLKGYGIKNPFKRLVKGLGGLYGVVSYASDLLSYSRILALGLVAAVIAKVVNMITMLGHSGIIGVIAMVVILLAGHALNLAVNVLGAFVHTSRLQYLEFFGKFYEDGGTPFEPCAPSDEYSEAIDEL